jgi:glycosyltransferase involved in cell wall biosynthesis
MIRDLTALLLAYNEAPNIGRTLRSVSWVPQIILIDSGSTDGTAELARAAHPNVRIVERAFDTHPKQWNFGLDQVTTEWVLSLDADYEVSPALAQEISELNPDPRTSAYTVGFQYRIFGRSLRGSVYPPRVVLFRRAGARYVGEGHTQVLKTGGQILKLRSPMYHDDRKPLTRWLEDQSRYSKIEAVHLRSQSREQLSPQDRLRRQIFFAPPIIFCYLLLVRGLVLDGWPGWFYICQRTIAEFLLSIRLLLDREKLGEIEDGEVRAEAPIRDQQSKTTTRASDV